MAGECYQSETKPSWGREGGKERKKRQEHMTGERGLTKKNTLWNGGILMIPKGGGFVGRPRLNGERWGWGKGVLHTSVEWGQVKVHENFKPKEKRGEDVQYQGSACYLQVAIENKSLKKKKSREDEVLIEISPTVN